MKVAFLSLYFNHHQKPFAEEMVKRCGFTFIETGYMPEERKKLGYENEKRPNYVLHLHKDSEECKKTINEADVIIYGSAPDELIKKAVNDKKLVFKYSERIYKEPLKWYTVPFRAIKYNKESKNMYLLCASAYTASDYAKTGTFKGRAYKWGYFPECKKYESIDTLIEQKQKNSILWCGRVIDWKHPEFAVKIAKRLKDEGYDFQINIIGDGTRLGQMVQLAYELDVEDKVQLLGSMPPEFVREKMEQSEIFIATSGRKEGWGVVINEAMNSGCAIVASNEMGAAPYLIKNGENGLLYFNDSENELYEKVKFLLDNKEKRVEYSKNAYKTITEMWNGQIASENLISLINGLLNGEDVSDTFGDGICSPAK